MFFSGKCCNKSVDCLTLPPLFLYIQMQLCRRDTLKEWLKDNDLAQIDLKYRMEIFQQVTCLSNVIFGNTYKYNLKFTVEQDFF